MIHRQTGGEILRAKSVSARIGKLLDLTNITAPHEPPNSVTSPLVRKGVKNSELVYKIITYSGLIQVAHATRCDRMTQGTDENFGPRHSVLNSLPDSLPDSWS